MDKSDFSTDISSASTPIIFFTIFDFTKGTFVFNSGALAPNTPSLTLPANTLAFGDSFSYEIDFSNRDFASSPNTTFPAQIAFDLRTEGLFTTAAAAAPEPPTLVLCGLALLAVAFFGRRRVTAR